MNIPPLRVLVVDDDEEDFMILRDLLAEHPYNRYQLDWVATLAEGVEALRADTHDVFLVDYVLGHDNGLDLVRLAVSEDSMHRPIILLTGHGNADVDAEAMHAGASDYLVKGSIDAEKLARSIRYAAEHARQLAEIRSSSRRYSQLFDGIPIPAWVFDCQTGRFMAVNDAMVRHYGYSRAELLQMTSLDIRSESEGVRLCAYLKQLGSGEGFAGEWEHLRKDGSALRVEITTHPILLDERACRMTIANDITERCAVQAKLHLLERAVQSSMSGVVIVDAREPDFPITFVNAAFERITGYGRDEVIGRNCRFLQGSDRDQPEFARIRHALSNSTDCNVIVRNYRKNGTLIWNDLAISPVRDADGLVTHYVGVQNDLTERRVAEDALAYAASHDPITGLPRYPVLEPALVEALIAGSSRTLLFIDIDRFHSVNESMGNVFGDEVLRLLASRLRETLGDRGQLARFAGDEFVAIAPLQTIESAHALAEELRSEVLRPFEADGYHLRLSVSIGISQSPEHGVTAADLLRRAEAAMTAAKHQGRNAVCMFSVEQMREVEDRLQLGARLRRAISSNELELFYQPLVRSSDEKIVSFEALLRWTSAELGPVSPARFIPIAESLGLMTDIGRWVIDAACRQLRAWQDVGLCDFTVAINLSAQELQRPDVVSVIRDTIDRHRIPASRLEIEITESSLMEHVGRVVTVMAEIRQMGVRISLDDFGTGYSSLAYLKLFSLDKLKIDRSFVKDLPDDADAAAIARTIIAIGHQLRMNVVAEGVETRAQAEFLRDIGCDQFQGYLFSPPVAAHKASALISQALLTH